MACLEGLACWPCSADNWLYRHTQQLAVCIVQPSAQVTRVSVGQQRDACALTKRTVVQGECRKPQCTCPFPAAHKPTNQTRGVDIPKHQSVSASCQTTISLWVALYWPRMGLSLTSGGRLRRNVPCRVCQTCSSRFSDPSIAMPRHQADRAHGDIRVRSHNASHNFPRENDPKIRPANPPYKEPVARKKQGQRFTKNDH